MQILKRAKGEHGDLVGVGVPENQIRDEVNRRTHRAGYTNRHGEPNGRTKIMQNGIGESKLNVWPRDKNGELIG